MSDPHACPVVSTADAPEQGGGQPSPWSGTYRVLADARKGGLGVIHNRLPPGGVGCPFHWHAREDEAFYVLSGRGVLRYGDAVYEIGPGDCVSCPAGTRTAHQIANPFDQDLVYLAIGPHDPHEVCGYPDNGKILVRSAQTVGRLEAAPYMDGEPDPPRVFAMGSRNR